MLFEKLTDLDKTRIKKYITHHVGNLATDLETILKPWDKAKSAYLFDKFGGNFIIKEQVSFTEGYDEIAQKLDGFFSENRHYKFYHDFLNAFDEYYQCSWGTPEHKIYRAIYSLFDYEVLIANKYFIEDYVGMEIPLPNGKKIRLQKDCKPMRIIGKIAEAYQIEGFEEFRIAHSLCLNTKQLSGELCLSIHPLDFMTMSDNDDGWGSCMSWDKDEHAGEYKQGTVEMMNSPCVVVGYLSDKDFTYAYTNGPREEVSWNSKKWRCLFIVDKDFIISIKQYPYQNDNLVSLAVSKLAETMGWGKNIQPFKYQYSEHLFGSNFFIQNDRKVRFSFSTGAMYNDFGAVPHYAIINPEVTDDFILDSFYYSGYSECVICGNTCPGQIGETGEENYLMCTICDPRYVCECCGDRIQGDTYTTLRDEILCQWCYQEQTACDAIEEELYLRDQLKTLYLSQSEDGFVYSSYKCIYVLPYEDYENSTWLQFFKTEEPHYYNSDYWVSPSECTEEGLELFGIYDDEDLKRYMDARVQNVRSALIF